MAKTLAPDFQAFLDKQETFRDTGDPQALLIVQDSYYAGYMDAIRRLQELSKLALSQEVSVALVKDWLDSSIDEYNAYHRDWPRRRALALQGQDIQ